MSKNLEKNLKSQNLKNLEHFGKNLKIENRTFFFSNRNFNLLFCPWFFTYLAENSEISEWLKNMNNLEILKILKPKIKTEIWKSEKCRRIWGKSENLKKSRNFWNKSQNLKIWKISNILGKNIKIENRTFFLQNRSFNLFFVFIREKYCYNFFIIIIFIEKNMIFNISWNIILRTPSRPFYTFMDLRSRICLQIHIYPSNFQIFKLVLSFILYIFNIFLRGLARRKLSKFLEFKNIRFYN